MNLGKHKPYNVHYYLENIDKTWKNVFPYKMLLIFHFMNTLFSKGKLFSCLLRSYPKYYSNNFCFDKVEKLHATELDVLLLSVCMSIMIQGILS